jgi:pyruvate/2-oxoglutarate dehydrogenase complex dihydrolipoamide dehydrogenase (E3) component
VEVQLGTELTAEILKKIDPEVVILAAGGMPITLEIPGLNETVVKTAHEIFKGKEIKGKKVLIIGGGMIGCEAADYISEQGKEVTIVEITDTIALDMPQIAKIPLINDLKRKKVNIITNTKVISVEKNGAWIKTGDKKRYILADEIVFSVGSMPNTENKEMVTAKGVEIFIIGDNDETGTILKAISDGYNVGKNI